MNPLYNGVLETPWSFKAHMPTVPILGKPLLEVLPGNLHGSCLCIEWRQYHHIGLDWWEQKPISHGDDQGKNKRVVYEAGHLLLRPLGFCSSGELLIARKWPLDSLFQEEELLGGQREQGVFQIKWVAGPGLQGALGYPSPRNFGRLRLHSYPSGDLTFCTEINISFKNILLKLNPWSTSEISYLKICLLQNS